MLAPISWLKDFVDIKIPLKDLMWKMTQAGLTCESYKKVEGDIVLDVEVTANRPDWMSIVGIAREIAAIQNLPLKFPKIKSLPKKSKSLPITFKNNFEVMTRWSAVAISEVKIKPSPEWMQHRLKLIGLRPINNVVDITNYVMFELGVPMHTFDYDEIKGHIMVAEKANGGEVFTSVDGISYKLPKDAMIIKDAQRVIDLCGIKGGLNSGITVDTKNLLIHSTIDNPVLTRKSSIALGLRSDASAIYERGPDKGGTIQTLNRMGNLILEVAGGVVASEVTDIKNPVEKFFEPWPLVLTSQKLEWILGIKIDPKEVKSILYKLNLNPKKITQGYKCLIPTYRGDIHIEEDLVEEVARIYGYNKFPKTLPVSSTNSTKIPYYFDDSLHLELKQMLVASGFSEAITLSLISEELINKCQLDKNSHIRLANPINIDYEYLQTSLLPSLLSTVNLNVEENTLRLFEVGKTFTGRPGKTEEPYKLGIITKGVDFVTFKGVIDLILKRLNVNQKLLIHELAGSRIWSSNQSSQVSYKGKVLYNYGLINPQVLDNFNIKENIYALELDIQALEMCVQDTRYKPLPKYPAQIEDVTLVLPPKTKVGEIMNLITSIDKSVTQTELKEIYQDAYTFRIWYQDPDKTLNNEEVVILRNKILSAVKTKLGGIIKDQGLESGRVKAKGKG